MRFLAHGFLFGLYSVFASLTALFVLSVFGVIFHDSPNIKMPPFAVLIAAPLVEEFIYRFLPIRCVKLFTTNKIVIRVVIIFSSAVFGAMHGYWYNIFIQGFSGIIFSVAFLKGGYRASVVAHATHNGVLMVLSRF